jgi:AraC-like DNA-binding protein
MPIISLRCDLMKNINIDNSFLSEISGVEQFEQVFNNLEDIYFWVKNKEGQFVFANQIFIEKCGALNESDILGKTDMDFFPKDRAARYMDDDHRVIESGQAILDRVELAPEGEQSLNHFITSKFPLRNRAGEVIGTIGVARDLMRSKDRVNPFIELSGVIEYIHKNYTEQIAIGELARISGMSISLFERRFKEIFQITPRQYVIDIRLGIACKMMINSRLNIAQIAYECGFYDHSHFTRQFRKKFGISPKDYRRLHRNL